jgi:hypothetical protein
MVIRFTHVPFLTPARTFCLTKTDFDIKSGLAKTRYGQIRLGLSTLEGVRPLKCHYHPRANATAECSVCGVSLCLKCTIEDRGAVFCDGCYAAAEGEEETKALERESDAIEDEDYVDLELMDLLDTDEDPGLF